MKPSIVALSICLSMPLFLIGGCSKSTDGADTPAGEDGKKSEGKSDGTVWERLCAAIPADADHDAALAALAAVPGAKQEQPDFFVWFEDAPKCQRIDALKMHVQQQTGSEWVCPALEKSLACDPKDDLAWICERASEFTADATGPLTADDHRNFVDYAMMGRQPPALGTPVAKRPPMGKPSFELDSGDDSEQRYDFHPDLAYGGESGCELIAKFEAHGKAAGEDDWSCPALAIAVGCEG